MKVKKPQKRKMEKAILFVLKDKNGTYPFPGGSTKIVDLFCFGKKVKVENVVIDSTFKEYNSYEAGRIGAIKLSSASCPVVYALGSAESITALQGCCFSTKNYIIGLSCIPGATIKVYDVLGNEIGEAASPAQYASIWNANPNNQIIGVLFANSNWTFVLKHFPGNIKPLIFECTSSQIIYECPTGVVVSSTGVGNIHVVFTAGANKNYVVHLYTNSLATSELTGFSLPIHPVYNVSSSPITASDDFNGLAGGDYYIEVREAGSTTKCAIYHIAVDGAEVITGVEWQNFNDANEPIALDTINYTHKISHAPETDASINITGMQANEWLVVRFPATESNFLYWFNTPLQGKGTIPDQVFLQISVIGQWKYIKSRTSVSFDVSQPLIFSRS